MTAAPDPGRPVTRIVVADDHQLARAGLRHLLAGEPDLTVIGEAENGAEAVDLATRLEPDVVLMDVRMPVVDGIEATRALAAARPATAVVIVTISDDPDILLRALRAGARGYVLKDVGRAELLNVVRRARDGVSTVDPSLAASLLQRLAAGSNDRAARGPDPLTRREAEILRLVAEGRTNREIAGRLLVAVGTVKVHVEHILAKLGVADRTQAAVRAVEMGLVGGDEPELGEASAARARRFGAT